VVRRKCISIIIKIIIKEEYIKQLIGTNQKNFLKMKSNNITNPTNIRNINYKSYKHILQHIKYNIYVYIKNIIYIKYIEVCGCG
jgi:hypothetical protein